MLELAYTKNKAAIRQLWDATIIGNFAKDRQKRLDYFGLPGPDIQDLIDWKEYIGFITGVEYSDRGNGQDKDAQFKKISKLMQNLMLLDLGGNWEVRRGRLEDIILNGADVDGNKPFNLRLEKDRPINMYYDIHNWDFQNGLGYSNKKKVDDKVEAIKRCMQLQRGYPFLFLLTLNVRHNLKEEPQEYLLARAREHKHQEPVLSWYANKSNKRGMDHYRTKALVPLFVRETAHQSSYDCFTYPPIYYQGPSEHLLHFVFLLSPKETILPSYSSQAISDVVNQPLIKVEDGKFVFPEQHPGFDKKQAVIFLASHNLPVPK